VSPRSWRAAILVLVALLGTRAAFAQTLRTLSSARQLHGETALTVDVSYAAGRFRLAPVAAGDLYRMDLRYDEDRFTPVRDYDPASGVLRLGLKGRSHNVSLRDRRRGNVPSLDVALTAEVPLALDIELGAAEADVEFGGLALRRVSYRTGASKSSVRFSSPNPLACDALSFEVGAAEFTATGLGNANCRQMSFEGGVGSVNLDFTGSWRASADARVHVALGSVTLSLPRDVGVAISLDRFLASFDHYGFTKRGDRYYSDNFSVARYHLNLNVAAVFGGIDVHWVDNHD
jgi:hypothetical protein